MPVVSGAEFLKAARQGGYAVGGFNTNNLEWTQAILKAAESASSNPNFNGCCQIYGRIQSC